MGNPESDAWIKKIKENPSMFPKLNHLLYLNELQNDRWLKTKEYAKLTGKLTFPPFVVTYLALEYLTKKMPMAKGNLTRRNFFKTLALGSSAALVGRSADLITTGKGMREMEGALDKIKNNQKFKTLPSKVQSRLFPSLRSMEANPLNENLAEENKDPRQLIKSIPKDTAKVVALSGLIAALVKKFRSDKSQPIGRREFLTTIGAISLTSLVVAASNNSIAKETKLLPKAIDLELNELHNSMKIGKLPSSTNKLG